MSCLNGILTLGVCVCNDGFEHPMHFTLDILECVPTSFKYAFTVVFLCIYVALTCISCIILIRPMLVVYNGIRYWKHMCIIVMLCLTKIIELSVIHDQNKFITAARVFFWLEICITGILHTLEASAYYTPCANLYLKRDTQEDNTSLFERPFVEQSKLAFQIITATAFPFFGGVIGMASNPNFKSMHHFFYASFYILVMASINGVLIFGLLMTHNIF